jgi:NAD(P)-dependent dehydrogenase (short-subunit alcohol dehydrogenase family)
LDGRHILILGGSGGMGYATAAYLLRAGAIVTICARKAPRLEAARGGLLAETGASPDALRALAIDARDSEAVDQALSLASDAAGQLNGIFIVAGGAQFIGVTRNTLRSMADEWATNMFPVINAITSAVPRMRKSGGSIVAVSSVAAIRTFPGLSGYGAAKAGLEHYVRVAADELGQYKIRVNAVQPGLTKNSSNGDALTDEAYLSPFAALTPLGPYGEPEDFGPMVALLLSDESAWITGQTFAIDGGMSLRAYGGRLTAPE